MENLIDTKVQIFYILTSLLAIFLFYKANRNATKITLAILTWGIIISTLSYLKFFSNPDVSPLRIFIALSFPIVLLGLGLSAKGIGWMLANRNTKWSTLLHIVRIPIELTLFYLFLLKMIPELMTFEGRNFDILAGITAVIIGAFHWFDKVNPKILLWWNYLGLGLVLFILINAILSAPLPIQQFAFDQPNIAILYFPITLLPAILVPMVVYTHITDIKYWRDKLSK